MRHGTGFFTHAAVRWLALSGASLVVSGLALVGIAAAANTVEPVDDNPTCTDLGFASGIKLEAPFSLSNTQYTSGSFSVYIDVDETNDGQVMSWSQASAAVSGVLAKGGPSANLYVYDPAATSGTGVHSPVVPSGKYADFSHIDFCFGTRTPTTPPTTDPPTTPTTPTTTNPPTTATTAAQPVIIVIETTTTVATTTTTTTEPTTTTAPELAFTPEPEVTGSVAPAAVEMPRELAFTGDHTSETIVVGLVLVTIGVLLLVGSRRRAQLLDA